MPMDAPSTYRLLADAVLVLHVGIVVFVVGGLPLIAVGHRRRWRWVQGWGFRVAHGAAIAVVVAQVWLDQVCALTTLESWLRQRAGDAPYAQSFVGHWLQRLLYHAAPAWVFTLAYTAFGLLVAWAWRACPPRRR
jgi:hypothetical protein